MTRIAALCIHVQTQELVQDLAPQLGVEAGASLVAPELALGAARTAVSQGARALVAEERLWMTLSRLSPVPVVPCPVGPWEVVQALGRCTVDPVAVIHFGPDLMAMEDLGQLLGRRVQEVRARREPSTVRALIQELKAGGVRAVVGGEGVVALARRQGLQTQPVWAGREAVTTALLGAARLAEAIPLSQSAQEEYCRAAAGLPAGLVSLGRGETRCWGGKAPELADRARALVSQGQSWPSALQLGAFPGVHVESLGEGSYAVHDLVAYRAILAKDAREVSPGGDDGAGGESVVVSVGTLEHMQDQIIAQLARRHQNRTQLARRLGISRTTLWKKLRESTPETGLSSGGP